MGRKARVAFPHIRDRNLVDGKTIKVLFLDFDGVINTYRGHLTFHSNISFKRFAIWLVEKGIYGKTARTVGKVIDNSDIDFLKRFKSKVNLTYRKVFWKYLANDDGFDPYAFFWLKKLLELHPDLRIVISSVWKFAGVPYLKRLLAQHGIDPERIISSTPRVDSYRGKEVAAWLKGLERNPVLDLHTRNWDFIEANTPHEWHKQVSSFAIVDDDSDLKPFYSRFTQTNGHDGLGHREFKRLDEILNKPLRKRL